MLREELNDPTSSLKTPKKIWNYINANEWFSPYGNDWNDTMGMIMGENG